MIVAALLAAFVLFLAARGRLPLYASVLWGPKPAPTSEPAASESGNGNGSPGGFEMPDLGNVIPDFGDMFEDFDFGDVAKVLAFLA